MSTTRTSATESGNEIDLGADQVGIEDSLGPGHEADLDRAGRGQLLVDERLDRYPEPLGQRVELEVHPGRQRLHVARR